MTRTYARQLKGDDRSHEANRAAALYVQGCTIASVARQIGRSYGNTRTLLIEAGVQLRSPNRYRPRATK
ncbi:helix-turn-helix domain-containing protein [Streptomyces sp. NPDC002547]